MRIAAEIFRYRNDEHKYSPWLLTNIRHICGWTLIDDSYSIMMRVRPNDTSQLPNDNPIFITQRRHLPSLCFLCLTLNITIYSVVYFKVKHKFLVLVT